jgi:hypothetical protein
MKQLSVLTFLITALFAATALAASNQPQRLRGTIHSFSNDQLLLHTRNGKTKKVALNDNTTYVYVVKSSLSAVKQHKYVGIATKKNQKKNGKLVALEVVVFPESMRGAGEGHYSWDKLPAPGKSGKMVSSSMTNGSVQSTGSGSTSGKLVSSSMTNGNVKSSQTKHGAKVLTVAYKGGKKHIIIPSDAPIVTFKKADHSALEKGAKVFAMAAGNNGQLTAKLVAVGKNGLQPPM